MILYFSATGNCEYIAKKIAEATGENAVSITEIGEEITLADGERLGIVTPTYFWGLPSCVDDFLTSVRFVNAKGKYTFCVATYGTTTGQTDYFIRKCLQRKGLTLSASYGIKTVDNYTVWFNVNDKTEIEKTLVEENKQLAEVIAKIQAQKNEFIQKDKKPLWLCKGAQVMYNSARKTKHWNVLENCIGCGLCAKDCPTQAIEIKDGKPVWIKDKCAMCFRCLHRCPVFAIHYDNKTQKNGQYVHPKA